MRRVGRSTHWRSSTMMTIGASSAASTSRSRVARAMANGSTGWSAPSRASAARTADARAGARRSSPSRIPSSSSARPDQASSTSASTPARRTMRQSGWSTAMIAAASSTTAVLPMPASPTMVSAPPSPTAAPAASPAIASTTSWRPWSGREGVGDARSFMGARNTGCPRCGHSLSGGRLSVGASAQVDQACGRPHLEWSGDGRGCPTGRRAGSLAGSLADGGPGVRGGGRAGAAPG